MSSHAAQKASSKSNAFHVALTRVAAIGVLLGLSLVTWAYQRALEPQYGSAPTTLHLSKIVWSASILGSFAPVVPLSRATLGLALLLYALPNSSYWAAAYTARLGDPILGPVATHLIVLLPVLSLGVAIVKALQEAPYTEDKSMPQSSITLPVCATAINALQGLWPIIAVFTALPPDQLFLQVGTVAMACWAIAPFLPDVSAPPAGATKPPAAASNPTSSEPKGKRKKGTSEKAASANTNAIPPPPKRRETSLSAARIRLALIPVLPYLTRTVLRGPTLPQPLLEPWSHPSYPLRILSSEQSTFSGVVVVGESLESPGVSTGIEHMRYLRAGHSLLGGVWIGPKVTALDPGLVLQDEAGDKLGDTVYTAFVLQEAALLAKKAGNARPKNALIIGLGTGISATSFMRHGLSTTVVEIDPVVYGTARRFFGLPVPDQVFLEDARGWVHNRSEIAKTELDNASPSTSKPYDIVVHDCFSGGGIPAHLYTRQLWQDLKNIVSSDGVVAVNYAGVITSDSAKAVVLTLRSVFPQCRAFYDAMEPSADAVNDFQNWVFFCTPSSDPLKLRDAIPSDFLGSYLRRHVFSSLAKREADISTLGSDIPEDKREGFILTDRSNPLGDWQRKDAMHHWKIMRQVLPDVFWESY